MQPLIVSYSGIRGIAGASLTEEVALRFGRAFGRLVARRHATPTILLGRDTRPSGPGLLRGATAGLAPFGRLVDLGVVATPTLQYALGALSADAALCVTASHNPAEWNGLKLFLAPDNTVLDGEQIRELRAEVEADAGAPPAAVAAPEREERHDEAVRRHVAAALAQVDAARIRPRGLRVALDCAGGAGRESTEALLRALGCEVVPVATSRESEPVAENLGDLRRAVVAARCDLGLAQDLDGDRLALVTEEGVAPGEESTLVLAVDHLLRRRSPGGRVVVKNVATTRAVDDVAARHGAALVSTPVGEVNLSRALLRELRAGRTAFGGEGNGGVIYPPVSLGRDALVGAALVLESLAAGGGAPLSARLAALPRYHGRKLRVALAPGVPLDALLARIEAAFPGGEPGRVDGLALAFPGGSWFVARPSNTEPILRVVAESPDAAWLDETLGRIEELLDAPA